MSPSEVWMEIAHRARGLGFARVGAADIRPLTAWREAAEGDPRSNWAKLQYDPCVALPGARAALMLAFPYSPYCEQPGEPGLDAYYVSSNAAHGLARALADELNTMGFSALASPPVPIKPLFERVGLGRYGRNGLISVDNLGTRVALQLILTDAPLPTEDVGDRPGLSPTCNGCGLCVAACPTGALSGDGRVNMDRCLRALAGDGPLPDAFRPYAKMLVGCDRCQRICPRNVSVAQMDMPPALAEACALKRVLSGEVKPLVPWVGENYARKGRLMAAAALSAANEGRTDCLETLMSLKVHEIEAVRVCAAWAAERLEGRA